MVIEMEYTYQTQGTCSGQIQFELKGDKVYNIKFLGGCPGNLKAISKLLEGQTVSYIEEKLLGNTCGARGTSCADQLAKAVRQSYEESKSNEN